MSRCSLIPHHLTASVGSECTSHGRYYLLWRDSQTIMIQASPPVYTAPPRDHLDPDYFAEHDRQLDSGLEIIQSLLDTVKFGLTNWAYLVRQGENNYRLVYRHRPVHRISCRLWASLVEEFELEITQWISFHRRHALWKGKEVDVCISWNDSRAQYIEEETNGRRLMIGLDLTFELLGHIIRDGEVVGIMLDPAYGRPLRHDDRAIMYEAVARIQNRGLFFPMINNTNVLVSQGQIRFMGVAGVTRIGSEGSGVSSVEDAQAQHWRMLDTLFDTLDTTCYICQENRSLGQHAIIIPRLPSPDRPFPSAFDVIMQFRFYFPRKYSQCTDEDSTLVEFSNRREKYRRDTDCPLAPTEPWSDEDEEGDVPVVADPPLNERDIPGLSSKRVISWLPGAQARKLGSELLLAPEDNDAFFLSERKDVLPTLSTLSAPYLTVYFTVNRPYWRPVDPPPLAE
jgi:hypothetical protein